MSAPLTPISCACEHCAGMCARTTCLPTPDEARALIRAGFADRLATYRFWPQGAGMDYVGPAPAGQEGSRDLPNTKAGCTFHKGGLCELHDLGLKPWEGRVAHHTRDSQPIRQAVMRSWKGKQFDSVVATLNAHMRVS